MKKANLAGEGKTKTAAAKDRGGTPMATHKDSHKDTTAQYSWNFPDHLAPFHDRLPSADPQALELITPRPAKQLSKEVAAGQPIKVESHTEPPHKVRFPPKRITVGEMKKRVRSVLEYVGRIQLEEAKRTERAALLGIVKPELTPKDKPEDEDVDMEDEPPSRPTLTTANTAQLMDELTRDLIKFQEHFEAVPAITANGSAVPAPPTDGEPVAAEA